MGKDITLAKFILSKANQKHTTKFQNRVVDLEKTVRMLLSQNQVKYFHHNTYTPTHALIYFYIPYLDLYFVARSNLVFH